MRSSFYSLSIFGLLSFFALGGTDAPESKPIAQSKTANGVIDAVVSVGMTVGDMDRSLDFYSKVLSFEKLSDIELTGPEYERLTGVFGLRMRVVRLKLGQETLELTQYLTPRGRPMPLDSRSNDRWFQHVAIIVSDMDEAYKHLRKHRVEHASTGPQRLPDWNKNAGGIKAFYFRDPDGHYLEVLQFPPGKGDQRWHTKSGRLFLGIDHTAIVVADTDASLAFYRDRLGLNVVGNSENYGTEQEHLNNVFGARLRITTLRAAKGPGVEFLEYLSPRDGRSTPIDSRPNDHWHWQIRLHAPDVDASTKRLGIGSGRVISQGITNLADDGAGGSRAVLARDADGHSLIFTSNE